MLALKQTNKQTSKNKTSNTTVCDVRDDIMVKSYKASKLKSRTFRG